MRRFRIVICRGPECGDLRGSAVLQEAFACALDAHGVRDRAELVWQSCFGRCTQGPNVLVREVLTVEPPALGTGFATLPGPRGSTALYNRMDAARSERVVAQHVVGGQIVRELIEPPGGIRPIDPVASTLKDSET
jgi:(2Fe-2S) ferredoxin